MYYLTLYNEPYPQPAEPDDLDVDGLLRGMYRFPGPRRDTRPAVRLLASGVAVPWALAAQELLAQDWGVAAEVWSVTSWGELRRDGVECDRHNLRQPQAEPRVPHVRRVLSRLRTGTAIPVVGVSDWMRAVPDLIRPWVPAPFTTWAPTGSASPTPGRPLAGTSVWTRSRSPSPRWPPWARRAGPGTGGGARSTA